MDAAPEPTSPAGAAPEPASPAGAATGTDPVPAPVSCADSAISPSPALPEGFRLLREAPGSAEYREMRRICDLEPRTVEQAVGALENSWAWAIVRASDGALASMGRVIGDGTWYFHFSDVATHPDLRRRGLSRAVMRDLLARIDDAAPPHPYISLIGDPPGQALYRALGFVDAAPSVGMILPR